MIRRTMSEETDTPSLAIKHASINLLNTSEAFSLRYYSGHKGKFGHEFLEFEITLNDDARSASLKYRNNSNYRKEDLIHKEATVSIAVVQQIKQILHDSELLRETDEKWPPKSADGKQELEIKAGRYHTRFETTKLGSLNDIKNSEDPDGLRVFYYVVQDIKALVFSLISLHFKVKPY